MNRHGRSRISASHPRAQAICDRCKFLYNHDDLQWQMEYAGPHLVNKRMLVCRACLDVPSPARRAVLLTADPVPVQNPRPQEVGIDDTPAEGYPTTATELLFPVPED